MSSVNNSSLPNVLLVNDEPFILEHLFECLQEHFNITTAENGLQATHIVHSNPPSYFAAVILDINMPIMDGYEACTNIHDFFKKEDSKTLIYALTADVSDHTVNKIRSYPFKGCFEKLAVDEEVRQILQDIAMAEHLPPILMRSQLSHISTPKSKKKSTPSSRKSK